MSSRETIPVLEIFGPTIQGEGLVIGRKTMFVRTAGCDYSCHWCDSAFTWDGSAKNEIRHMHAEEILDELGKIGGSGWSHVTLSGGNPALLSSLALLIDNLHERGFSIALETQGSRWQEWLMEIDDLTLSPKPPSSGMKTDWIVLDKIIARRKEGDRNEGLSLKVVVMDEIDLTYAVQVHQRYPDVPFIIQAGNDDPTSTDPDKLAVKLLKQYACLVDRVMRSEELRNVRVLPQLHALLWGNRRGV
ncbi:7-carboxy-7-deazaguanine synthase QueE [Marinicrinis sediminis]|uniref:7-carboxy-7-deazaguanine synthase n=1 Tax=Marinicrinis sediminis TaxID=1652465 RepID=A0ABW5R7L9_9BACL